MRWSFPRRPHGGSISTWCPELDRLGLVDPWVNLGEVGQVRRWSPGFGTPPPRQSAAMPESPHFRRDEETEGWRKSRGTALDALATTGPSGLTRTGGSNGACVMNPSSSGTATWTSPGFPTGDKVGGSNPFERALRAQPLAVALVDNGLGGADTPARGCRGGALSGHHDGLEARLRARAGFGCGAYDRRSGDFPGPDTRAAAEPRID